MTTILPSAGDNRFFNPHVAITLDPADLGQENNEDTEENGELPADMNDIDEKPGGGDAPRLLGMLRFADMETGWDPDPMGGSGGTVHTDVEGPTHDDDPTTDSLGGMGNNIAMLRFRADSRDRGWELIAPHDDPSGNYNATATEFSQLHDDVKNKIIDSFSKAGLDHEKMVQNIIATHRHAQMHNTDALKNGMTWYNKAHDFAAALAKKHGVPLRHAAAVLAAASPRNDWEAGNKPEADYILSKTGHNATRRGETYKVSPEQEEKAHGFAMDAYHKALDAHHTKLDQHKAWLANPKTKANPDGNKKVDHPGDEPTPPRRIVSGTKYADMGHNEAANAIYNQAKDEDLRVPEDTPNARTKPKRKGEQGELRKVGFMSGQSNYTKGVRLARGEEPDKVLAGHKVRSFFNNIMDPNNKYGHNDVTVDTHALGVATNSTNKPANEKLLAGSSHKATNINGAHAYVADAYREAHRRLVASKEISKDSHPHQLQAQTWEHWRGLSESKNFKGIDHQGGIPTGWKPGEYQAPEYHDKKNQKAAGLEKSQWINPLSGPNENPDILPKHKVDGEWDYGYPIAPDYDNDDDNFDDRAYERSKNAPELGTTSMLRWGAKYIEDAKIGDEEVEEPYDGEAAKVIQHYMGKNLGEDASQQRKSEEANAHEVNSQYARDADDAQDKWYFNYLKEHSTSGFGHDPNQIPNYMSVLPPSMGMLHWARPYAEPVAHYPAGGPKVREQPQYTTRRWRKTGPNMNPQSQEMCDNCQGHGWLRGVGMCSDCGGKGYNNSEGPMGSTAARENPNFEQPYEGLIGKYLYHHSPPENRESIAQHGLEPRDPQEGSARGMSEEDTGKTPVGVYFGPEHHIMPHANHDDIWAVDTNQVSLHPDPGDHDNYWGFHYSTDPVPPEALRLVHKAPLQTRPSDQQGYNNSEGTDATLHEEPEGALPSTDGGVAPSQLWDRQHSTNAQDPMSAQTPGDGDYLDPQDYAHEQMGDPQSDRAILSENPLHEPGVQDDPFEDLGATVASHNPSFADIAARAKLFLAKESAKVFTPQEQAVLINEGGTVTRARNFNRLQISGTHYENIVDDEEDLV